RSAAAVELLASFCLCFLKTNPSARTGFMERLRRSVDLIIPQSLLDGLPASRKIHVKDGADNTMHWWRLDGLFADENGNPINPNKS
ncbi:hypothetical protein ACQKFE_19410, partial [Stutzerimonas stutzeri]|uniref:hypothetical protein n=1 Tax=Stutzerimonas stutzeri TaxID=316 RepID=UPI003D036176